MAVYTAIDDAGSFFNTVLYTATGSSLGVTGAGFQPDFTWIKNRTAADFHVLTNSPKGATKYMQSNDNAAEVTNVESLKTFDSDGFTVGTMAEVNTNTEAYASWNWIGGTTSGITTDGSTTITPSAYSFNATSGFAALVYTGTGVTAKLAHGLGVAPAFWTTKDITVGHNWLTYTKGSTTSGTAADYALYLNLADPQASSSTYWGGVMPDSVNLTLGTNANSNASGETYVMYCFANVQGFSKFGIYAGNGNADGTFVYTGFKPAMIIMKSNSGTNYWLMADTKRDPFNVGGNELSPSQANAEGDIDSGFAVDILSNGFKPRAAGSDYNGAGSSYMYCAWALNPFANSNGVPSNAR